MVGLGYSKNIKGDILKYLLLSLMCAAWQPQLTAQTEYIVPKTPLTLIFDCSRFRYTEKEGIFEVNYLIYPSSLTLEKKENFYKGGLELWTLIHPLKSDTPAIPYHAKVPVEISDTTLQSLRRGYVVKVSYGLPFGSYAFNVWARDLLAPSKGDSVSTSITLASFGDSTSISDIVLCTSIKESQKKSDPFYKNSYELAPNPSLLFGGVNAPVIFSYTEFYHLDTGRTYTLKYAIVDRSGKVVKERVRQKMYLAPNMVDVSNINVVSLASGKYRFLLSLQDTVGKIISVSEKSFFIHNPEDKKTKASAISAKSIEFAGMSDDELFAEFRKARYVALPNDIETFEKLTTAEGRKEFLAKFWTDIEERQNSGALITRSVYLQRVTAANEKYASMGREGWSSDRGRVYVLFGEPDEIDRHPNSDENKPYEIWHYYQIENGVQFVFVDKSGYGEYLLIHSTKRGELQDEEWQRNLR
jgi:GWxTD domain-containing protein